MQDRNFQKRLHLLSLSFLLWLLVKMNRELKQTLRNKEAEAPAPFQPHPWSSLRSLFWQQGSKEWRRFRHIVAFRYNQPNYLSSMLTLCLPSHPFQKRTGVKTRPAKAVQTGRFQKKPSLSGSEFVVQSIPWKNKMLTTSWNYLYDSWVEPYNHT